MLFKKMNKLLAYALTLCLVCNTVFVFSPMTSVKAALPNLAKMSGVSYFFSSNSTISGSYGSSKAFDGDPATAWRYLSTDIDGGRYLGVKWTTPQTFDQIKLQEGKVGTSASNDWNDFIRGFVVEYRNVALNGSSAPWITGATFNYDNNNVLIGNSGLQTFRFSSITADEMRVRITATNPSHAANIGTIAEFEIYPTIGVSLDKTEFSMGVGETKTITSSVNPTEANQSVTWTIEEGSSLVNVVSSGAAIVFEALDEGTAKFRATSDEDVNKFAECVVTMVDTAFTAFSIIHNGTTYVGAIDEEAGTIALTLPAGTDASQLVATFATTWSSVTVSGATQQSGVTQQDFSQPVVYTVTKGAKTKQYTVTVNTRTPNSKLMESFAFAEGSLNATGIIEGSNINIVVPNGTNLQNLKPIFSFVGERVKVGTIEQQSGLSPQNFTNPVTYRIFADNGTFVDYVVNVFEESSSAPTNLALNKRVDYSTFYSAGGPNDHDSPHYLVDGNTATTVRRLSTDILPSYFLVDLGEPMNFNQIVLREALRNGGYRTWGYSVYISSDMQTWKQIENGGTIGAMKEINFATESAQYVRLMVDVEDGADLPTFSELEVYKKMQPVTGIGNLEDTTLNIGERKALVATVSPVEADQRTMWSSSDSSVAVVDRFGVVTGVGAGTATIKATSVSDTSQSVQKTVTVSSTINDTKEITSFVLNLSPVAIGTITGNNIAIVVPNTTDLTNVAATFKTTGKTVEVLGTEQISGLTTNDFNNPVTYKVTAADGTSQSYIVTVTKQADTKSLLTFALADPVAQGSISSRIVERKVTKMQDESYRIEDVYDSSVTVVVPEATDLTALVATFTTDGQEVLVNGISQISGTTQNDFSGPVVFKIIAENGTYSEYTIRVLKDLVQANVVVENEVVGKSMKYVGYSSQTIVEGDNLPEWLQYAGINAVRYWISPSRYVGDTNVTPNTAVDSLTHFDNAKNDLRNKMKGDPQNLDESYIKWSEVETRMNVVSMARDDRQTLNDALSRLQEANIDVLAEVHSTDSDYNNEAERFSNSWVRWQSFYAVAFYLAKNYDIYMFEGPNEPELTIKPLINATNSVERAEGVEKFNYLLKIYSDAVRCAVADVNEMYGKSLTPIFAAPTLASSPNSDITVAVMKGNRTDYAGNPTNFDIVDHFVDHVYSTTSEKYRVEAEKIYETMDANTVTGERLPVIYTEFNYSGAANWKNLRETSDTPEVFQTEAMVWQTNMLENILGMYQFKFAEKVVGENRNHIHYQFNKFRDPAKNIAIGKAIVASSNQATAQNAIDGETIDSSAWVSEMGQTDHSLIIDLGEEQAIKSYVLEIGKAFYNVGSKKYDGLFGNFKLQYSTDKLNWQSFVEQASTISTNYLIGDLETPVLARYVRFVATTTNTATIMVRDIMIGTENLYFDIGGPMKSAEVTRLFAQGFKNERPLYRTTATVAYDNLYQASTSFDEETGRYYIWIPQSSDLVDYMTTIDVSALNVQPTDMVTIKEVSKDEFGGVVYAQALGDSKTISQVQQKTSVWLVTIQTEIGDENQVLEASKDASVKIGEESAQNNGSHGTMTIRESNIKDDNSISYIEFETEELELDDLGLVQLSVTGEVDAASASDNVWVHVYGFTDSPWDELSITGENAPFLNRNAAFVESSIGNAFPVAIMSFSKTQGTAVADVTDFVKSRVGKNVSFILIKEKRRNIEVNDNDFVVLQTKEGGANAPILSIASKKTQVTDPRAPEISPTTAQFDISHPTNIAVDMTRYGKNLHSVQNGSETLALGTDYSVLNDRVFLNKNYFAAKEPNTTTTLTFCFDDGNTAQIAIAIVKTPVVDPRAPEISPTTAQFDISHPTNIAVDMTRYGKNLHSVQNGSETLALGTDYSVSNDRVFLNKNYFAAKEPNTTATLTFCFDDGNTAQIAIAIVKTPVVDPRAPEISPTTAQFDISHPTNIAVDMTRYGKNLHSVQNGSETLVLGTDYSVLNDRVFLNKNYFAAKEPNTTTTLTFCFDDGNTAQIAIAIVKTPVVDPCAPEISPTTAQFDISHPTNIAVDMTRYGKNLHSVQNGSETLALGTDYSVLNDRVFLNKNYFAAKAPNTTATLTFCFDDGNTAQIAIAIVKTPVVDNSDDESDDSSVGYSSTPTPTPAPQPINTTTGIVNQPTDAILLNNGLGTIYFVLNENKELVKEVEMTKDGKVDLGDLTKGNYTLENGIVRGLFTIAKQGEPVEIKLLPLSNENILYTDTLNHWARKDVVRASYYGYVKGTGNNQFDPNNIVTRAEFATILMNYLKTKTSKMPDIKQFADMQDSWAQKDVGMLATIGIVSGVGNNEFQPDAPITREQMIVMMMRLSEHLQLPLVEAKTSTNDLLAFDDSSDVSPWAMGALKQAVANGFVLGKENNTIAPKALATRAEAVVMLLRMADTIL